MKRTLLGLLVAATAALALPAGAAAEPNDRNCDQPHTLNPPRLNCTGPEGEIVNEYLAILDPLLEPLWP